MDVSIFIAQRLHELGLGQKDLADAAEVTESYISQLLTRKKAPPAPARTDIYEKMERRLRLAPGELARLADVQRKAHLKRELGDEPDALFPEIREMLLRKCLPDEAPAVQAVFERQPFGELERLAVRAMLEATRPVARQLLHDERWMKAAARRRKRSYEEMRVAVLEFLDTERSAVTVASYAVVLDPLVASWQVDLATLDFRIVLSPSVSGRRERYFGFAERMTADENGGGESGLEQFLRDPALSGGATEDEIAFLRRLDLGGRRPTPLYFYRELQSLRDPLHFYDATDAGPPGLVGSGVLN